MNPKAIVGLVRSRMAYVRDWPECVLVADESGEPTPERVFDLSELLRNEEREVSSDLTVVGRHMPFPTFAMVGSGHGVFIVSGDEDSMYCYCYTAPVPMVLVRFTETGWSFSGYARHEGGSIEDVSGADPRVKDLVEVTAMLLTLVDEACANTRHVVSYTLNRTERRNAIKETGVGTLDRTLVHHVCLNTKARDHLTHRRGDSVVPTPKRLHEVRSHWRHLQSGAVVRVRSHRRGSRGDIVLPRVYTAKASTESPLNAASSGSEIGAGAVDSAGAQS